MKLKSILIGLITFGCSFSFLTHSAHSAWYPSGIEYQQAITKILKRGDINWGSNPDNYYNFGNVLVSADGSKVFFTGGCEFCSPAENRPFLVNPDGSGIQYFSSMLPSDIINRTWAWTNLAINETMPPKYFFALLWQPVIISMFTIFHHLPDS